MAEKLDAPLPIGFVMGPGWTVRVTAVSPTDGSTVSGVNVSAVVINGDKGGAAGSDGSAPLPDVPPLLVNEGPPS